MANGRAKIVLLVGLIAGCITTGCDKLRELAHDVPTAVIAPGANHAARERNVIPSQSPARPFDITIEDERSLHSIASRMGVTVEELIRMNKLPTTDIKPGQRLTIHASPEAHARYIADREVRKTRRAARVKRFEQERQAAAMKALEEPKPRPKRARKRRKAHKIGKNGKSGKNGKTQKTAKGHARAK